jgi:hypothetical protein
VRYRDRIGRSSRWRGGWARQPSRRSRPRRVRPEGSGGATDRSIFRKMARAVGCPHMFVGMAACHVRLAVAQAGRVPPERAFRRCSRTEHVTVAEPAGILPQSCQDGADSYDHNASSPVGSALDGANERSCARTRMITHQNLLYAFQGLITHLPVEILRQGMNRLCEGRHDHIILRFSPSAMLNRAEPEEAARGISTSRLLLKRRELLLLRKSWFRE